MTLGIMGALPEELSAILDSLVEVTKVELGSRTYYRGVLGATPVVAVLSRVGKVASASTATTLINHFGATSILFTGVAGAISPSVCVGDVVIGTHAFQSDMDASPIGFAPCEIPFLNRAQFELCPSLRAAARHALTELARSDSHFSRATVHEGVIASCDRFVNTPELASHIQRHVPHTLAVEMEGGAVAQVCHEWNVPLLLMRAISDAADHSSPSDFTQFVKTFAAPLSGKVVRAVVEHLS